MQVIDLPDAEATAALGRALAGLVRAGDLILLSGPLGAGKTTLVRALVERLGGDGTRVASPTFTLMNVYDADPVVCHVDAYRLQRSGELAGLGFFELAEEGIGIIEWPEHVAEALSGQDAIRIALAHGDPGRQARIEGAPGPVVVQE